MIIHVLGLGPSLKNYIPDGSKTIGCNDIWNYVKTDYVVCVDKPMCFKDEPFRMQGIVNGEQERFITHIEEWKSLVKNYYPIELSERGSITKLDTHVPHSNNSAFVACVMAYKFGAKKIIMHGVDLIGHHKLGQDRILKHAAKDFKALQLALYEREVTMKVSSNTSALANYLGVF